MRKIIVSQFMSIDGIIEGPGGEPDYDRNMWAFKFNRGPEGDAFKLRELESCDALLLGRKTYDGFAAAWPTVKDEEGFADKINTMQKYVVSSTLESADWTNSTIIRGDVAKEISALKESEGGDILVNGSAQLVNALAEHDLVDEYRLMVFPIILGEGKRLISGTSHSATLRLAETLPVGPDGIIVLTYVRA
jgi:dihydrofolate reductase